MRRTIAAWAPDEVKAELLIFFSFPVVVEHGLNIQQLGNHLFAYLFAFSISKTPCRVLRHLVLISRIVGEKSPLHSQPGSERKRLIATVIPSPFSVLLNVSLNAQLTIRLCPGNAK